MSLLLNATMGNTQILYNGNKNLNVYKKKVTRWFSTFCCSRPPPPSWSWIAASYLFLTIKVFSRISAALLFRVMWGKLFSGKLNRSRVEGLSFYHPRNYQKQSLHHQRPPDCLGEMQTARILCFLLRHLRRYSLGCAMCRTLWADPEYESMDCWYTFRALYVPLCVRSLGRADAHVR